MKDRCGVGNRVKAAWRRSDRIGTCWPVVGELWYGLEKSARRERNLPSLIRTLNEVYKWPFEEEAAKQFGRIRHELRSSGRIMQIVDIQLAAIAFAMGNCTVVSKDSDLSAVPGLQVGTGRRLNNLKGEKEGILLWPLAGKSSMSPFFPEPNGIRLSILGCERLPRLVFTNLQPTCVAAFHQHTLIDSDDFRGSTFSGHSF